MRPLRHGAREGRPLSVAVPAADARTNTNTNSEGTTMSKYADYPARDRKAVAADCPPPTLDCRNEHPRNPNTSSALYGLTSERYNGLAVRSSKAARRRKAREAAWVERSFRYEGLGLRKSGRGQRMDPDAGPTRAERDAVDAAIRSNEPAPMPAPRSSGYHGHGTKYNNVSGESTIVTRKAPGGKRTKRV
jgi:hypothetical protein